MMKLDDILQQVKRTTEFKDSYSAALKFYYPDIPNQDFERLVERFGIKMRTKPLIKHFWFSSIKARKGIVFMSVLTYIRHECTNYDERLISRGSTDRAKKNARRAVETKIEKIRMLWGEPKDCMDCFLTKNYV